MLTQYERGQEGLNEGEKYYILTNTEHEVGVESILYISKDREEVLRALGEFVIESDNLDNPEFLLAPYIFKNGKFEFVYEGSEF